MTSSKDIKIKPRGTISFKLSLFTAFLVFVFVMITTVILVQINKIKLEEDLKNTGSSLALALSSASSSAVISNDYLFIQVLPKMVSHEPDLLYLILVDNKNKCLVHTEEKFLDKLLKDKISQNALQFSKINKTYIQEYYDEDSGYKAYDIAVGIGVTKRYYTLPIKWATLRVGLSTRRLAFAIKEIYLRGLSIGVIIAIFCFLISFFVSKRITRTIFVFKDKLDQLQKDEKVEELVLKTGDEMEGITNSFNKMLRTWKEKTEELNTLKEKELLATIIEGMIDVVGISDVDGRIIQINTAVEAWGYKKEELIGKLVVEVLAKRSLPKLEEERKRSLETGVMRNLELIGLKKDGSEFPVLVNVTLMRDVGGKPTGRIFALRDITELKRAQEREKELAATAAVADVEKKRAEELEKSQDASLNIMEDLERQHKELEEKVKELEEFHDLTVGRELKMEKMEEEMEEMKKRLKTKS